MLLESRRHTLAYVASTCQHTSYQTHAPNEAAGWNRKEALGRVKGIRPRKEALGRVSEALGRVSEA